MSFMKRKLPTDSFSNLIAYGTSVTGTIIFTGVLRIEGSVNGDVIAQADDSADDCAIVGLMGNVKSDKINARNIVIAGVVSSPNIYALGTIRILKTARIVDATITCDTLEIEQGALLHNCKLVSLSERVISNGVNDIDIARGVTFGQQG